MDGITRPSINYRQAAERLLVALSSLASRGKAVPIPSGRLCTCMFDAAIYRPWKHESRRRRVREAVKIARKLLAEMQLSPGGGNFKGLLGDGQGYWLEADPRVLNWYAGQRRKRGVGDLVEAGKVKNAAQHASQKSLFAEVIPHADP